MKILSPQQLKEVETQTIQIQNIELINLMERAATAILNWLKARIDLPHTRFTIVCGIGNNGGDGLALARLVDQENAIVKVYLQKNNTYSLDNLTNQKQLKDLKIPIEYFDEKSNLEIDPGSLLIDAIFGYGLNRPISNDWANIIHQINEKASSIVSIDVPSGLFCDTINDKKDAIINADVVLTFQTPKLSLLLPENQDHVKDFEILDIGLDQNTIHQQKSKFNYVSTDFIPYFFRSRNKFSHKYDFGHALIIGGSYGKIGAVALAAKACLRAGAGLVTAYVPRCGYVPIQSSFPESMVMTDFSEDKIISFPDVEKFDSILVGPGLGTDEKTLYSFEQFLDEADLQNKNLIIDADAINLISSHREILKKLPKGTIITPHDGELERLVGKWKTSFEKIKLTQNIAKKHNIIVIVKGAYSQTYLPNQEVYFNSSGNPGMATAGSGDALGGILAAHLSKGFDQQDASILSVYLHGLAGDLASEQMGQESMLASDIINFLPTAFKKLFG